ncbi:hypothetical protein [Thalassoglobus sp.]
MDRLKRVVANRLKLRLIVARQVFWYMECNEVPKCKFDGRTNFK